ncbi:hypothetical protein Cycma_4263 [Cyclobacterium marinum DSM 745]|uniref:Uncharacterized protein n=1 Tax=Cyclobacterium marinum (strain ATCC 25205 / DSM 745 / LMG 13164 / NCIMB 1802) TaxID=880070 RepID=G0IWH2_CYCMS|nr:hypothetical protein Cycma_4263 [Cyclobacterium marinum DSM 745]
MQIANIDTNKSPLPQIIFYGPAKLSGLDCSYLSKFKAYSTYQLNSANRIIAKPLVFLI